MSIAITANFINSNTLEERRVEEIAGLSKQYDQAFFRDLEREQGIRLENIVYYKVIIMMMTIIVIIMMIVIIYYKDLTHYFVMTAKKDSLLCRGVIKDGEESRQHFLHLDNVDQEKLEHFARSVSKHSQVNNKRIRILKH